MRDNWSWTRSTTSDSPRSASLSRLSASDVTPSRGTLRCMQLCRRRRMRRWPRWPLRWDEGRVSAQRESSVLTEPLRWKSTSISARPVLPFARNPPPPPLTTTRSLPSSAAARSLAKRTRSGTLFAVQPPTRAPSRTKPLPFDLYYLNGPIKTNPQTLPTGRHN